MVSSSKLFRRSKSYDTKSNHFITCSTNTNSYIRKLAGFQKRFFWFGTDAVEVKSLSNYLRGEKPEAGNHNAAWASQTGKGLLYFSKQAGEKSAPVGLINLVSDAQIHVLYTQDID